ncbi:hypothetical protein QTL97_12605 [Sporosarcina thermotolerans]|uniref:Uncharacterized protein n=1 Tax=Sporosarcina thermotolerans TaxID=633404 RepID=A0AAW9A8N6_9BACL|nr:hypothetical protein [Sporosarcina thermotolerans]MDW0117782.1 hypothetical protein [Sporosarcina thermotolerans]
MSQYSKEELKFVLQALLPLCIIGGLATFLISNSGGFPWFTLLGTAIGLSIIILSWVGRKYSIFAASLIIGAATFTPLYNWSTIF